MHTLVLNADAQPVKWLPLSTCRWRDSIKYYFEDRVDIVNFYDDWVVHSPSMEMNVPAVVMVRDYIRHRHRVAFTRWNLFVRDGFRCQYCNTIYPTGELTMDHVFPQCYGGKSTWENCVTACHLCNMRKAHHSKMVPAVQPYRPSYWEMVAKRRELPLVVSHRSWLDYIDWPKELVRYTPPSELRGKRILSAAD